MVPVSRTIGQGRVADELIMRFTHSIRMDWILPGTVRLFLTSVLDLEAGLRC